MRPIWTYCCGRVSLPYEYGTVATKFYDKHLPERKYFYNSQTESEIKDKDYEQAQAVWSAFDMGTFGDYQLCT